MFEYMASAEETANTIGTVYHKAAIVLNNEMDTIFERYIKKHKLSEEEAKELLMSVKSKTSLEDIKRELLKAPAGSEKRKLLAELESPAYAARLNRLEEKQQQIDNLMTTVYNQEKNISTSHYKELAGESFNKSMYELQSNAGVGFSFNSIDKKTIDNMLNSKWSGKNYSTRIWNNTQKLADTLKQELMVGLLTGEKESEISKNILNDFAVGANDARRLVRTESCHVANEMDMKAYEEAGIDTYVYVATLDLKTSTICAALDGKRFPVKDEQPGVNAPPMHPWCRSTTICDISDEELAQMERRSRNPVTGKSEKVPANMTYEEWHKKFVDGKLENKNVKYQNRKFDISDKQQNYKPVSIDKKSKLQRNRKDIKIDAHKLKNSKNNIYLSDKVSIKPKEMHNIDKSLLETYKLMGITDKDKLPKIVVIAEKEFGSSTLASYNAKNNVLYVNKLMGDNKKIKELQKGYAASNNPLSTYYHELLHWKDAQEYVKKYGKIDSQSEYMRWINNRSKKDVEKLIERGYNISNISEYAKNMKEFHKYDEVYTEYRVLERMGR